MSKYVDKSLHDSVLRLNPIQVAEGHRVAVRRLMGGNGLGSAFRTMKPSARRAEHFAAQYSTRTFPGYRLQERLAANPR
jgi:hypothetical protein